MTDRALADAAAAILGLEARGDVEPVVAWLERLGAAVPGPARLGLRAGAGALGLAARTLTGRPLAELDRHEAEGVCEAVARRPGGAALLDGLKVPMLFAHGAAHPPNEGMDEAGEPWPDPELPTTPADNWPPCTTADVVVVGSGAGGAMAARTLARAGLDVVVVEEGRRHTVDEFRARAPLDRFTELYRDGGATAALGKPPVLLPLGRAVGGTTVVNSGTCFRTPDRVLRAWQTDHGATAAQRLPELLDEVETTLQVAPAPLDVLGRNGHLALAGARELGWSAAPLLRNAPGCGGCCQCAVGCPRNAKNGVHLNALPQACAAGARVLTRARARRVLVERGRAAGIQARRPDGSRLEILADRVIVAAGATETPALLRRSGLGRHPALGRGLAVHPAVSLAGRFDEPVVAWSGVLQSVGIDQLHDEGILIEATSGPPGMGSFVLPGFGPSLGSELERTGRLATLGAMVADSPAGRVHGARYPVVRYHLTRADAGKLRRAIVAMGEVLFAAGAHEVLTGMPHRRTAGSVAELSEIAHTVPAGALHLAAFHPTGSVKMGADPQRAPVDPSGRLRGVDGVHVADASLLPTCPEVNPQLTIMGLALAVADDIAPRRH